MINTRFGNSDSEWFNLDAIIFDALDLTQGEHDGIYEAVQYLVKTRLEKAKHRMTHDIIDNRNENRLFC